MAARLRLLFSHLRPVEALACGETHIHSNATSSTASVAAAPPAFKYTKGGSELTYQQRTFFEENGYLIIKKLVSPEKLDVYRKRFFQICKREVKVPNITFMRDIAIKDSEFVAGEQAISKIQEFQEDPVLFGYCHLPEILKYVEDIIGSDIVAGHSMFINKPPDTGKLTSRHPLHQDLYYSPFRPAELTVCAWTAMQTINRQNGCLVVVPGSHKGELLSHAYPDWEGVNKMYHGIQDFDPSCRKEYLEMEEGDTVFFHPLLVHGSGTNRTKGFRKSISCHFCSANCEVLEELEPVQKSIEDELVALRGKHFGESGNYTYQKFYLRKCRLIKGKLGTFGTLPPREQ